MTITLKYKTEDGKLYDSLEAAQMHEVIDTAAIYLEEWKEKKLFDALLAAFTIKLKPTVGTAYDISSDNYGLSSPEFLIGT